MHIGGAHVHITLIGADVPVLQEVWMNSDNDCRPVCGQPIWSRERWSMTGPARPGPIGPTGPGVATCPTGPTGAVTFGKRLPAALMI